MTLVTLLALSLALAMDAFAVALCTGIQLRCVSAGQTMRMAGAFGLFQFSMPVIGWFLGIGVQKYIESYDHWLAFGLLAFVGGRMLREAWNNRGKPAEECYTCPDPTRGGTIWLLAVATSIDALAVGLSMALLKLSVWFPALIIGLICFGVTACGMHLGRLVCAIGNLGNIGNKANALGGVVLIAIGIGILRDHGIFS